MYFATNLPQPTVPFKIAKEFEDLCAIQHGKSMHLFALIDCAFDEDFLRTRYRRTMPPQSLYDNTALQQFGAAAPHLIGAPLEREECATWLNYLFVHCGNKPMLSIIASPMAAEELVRHMRPYLVAMTDDTVEWPVRWGDTRVLPTLLEALDDSQRSHFLRPMARWWSPARDGGLLRWDGAAEQPQPAGFDRLMLSDEIFTTLVDAAEADSMLSRLYDSQPDLFHADSPASWHSRITEQLKIADSNGIQGAPGRYHFSALALILTPGFLDHPEMVGLLQRTRQGANYIQEINKLPNEFWEGAGR